MANAMLGAYVFDIDPSSASWGYSLNVSKTETYGGCVLQILSRRVDDLVISGYIPLRGGDRKTQFAEMERFEKDMTAIMNWQSGQPPQSITFSYPELSWYGQVFLMGYENVKYDIETSAAQYTLRFTVDTGFEGIANIAGIDGIDMIPSGVNWVRNKYNTPATAYTYEEIMEAVGNILDDIGTWENGEKPNLYDYLDKLAEADEEDGEEKDGEKTSKDKKVKNRAIEVVKTVVESRIQKNANGPYALMNPIASSKKSIYEISKTTNKMDASYAKGGKK